MHVPAVNIVVSFDAEAMIAFGNTKDLGVFKSFVENREEVGTKIRSRTYLFSNSPNSTFLSLEHFLGNDKDNKMSITILDPQGQFESEMLDNTLSKELDIRTDPIGQRIDELTRKKNAKSTALKELDTIVFDKSDSAKQNFQKQSQQNILRDELAKIELEIRETKDLGIGPAIDSTNKAIADQLKAHVGKMQKPVYITYGVGTNLQDWAPVQCFGKIIGFEYGFNGDGVRTLTLKFSGKSIHPNLVDMGIGPLGVNYTKGILAKGISNFRLFNEEGSETAIRNFMRFYKISPSDKPIVEKSFTFESPSIHWPIVEATEKFIKSATGYTNVLVLMPDLDKLLGTFKNRLVKSSKSRIRRRGGLTEIAATIVGYTKTLEALGYSLCEADSGEDSNLHSAIGQNSFKYIEECKSADTIDEWFNRNSYKVVLQTGLVTKTIAEKLGEVGSAITDKSRAFLTKNKAVKLGFISEPIIVTDFKLINFLFDKGMITDNTRPVIVWGDQNLINAVLYGRVFERAASTVAAQEAKKAEDVTDAKFSSETDLITYVNKVLDKEINPLDRLRGFDLDFVRDVFDYYVPTKWTGPFGPQYNGDDQLGTSLVNDTNLNRAAVDAQRSNPLLAARMPLFTFGNKNPNILRVDFDFDGTYFGALNSISPVGQAAFGNIDGIVPEDFKAEALRMFNGMKNMNLKDVDPETGVPNDFVDLMERYYEDDYLSGDEAVNFEEWQKIFNEIDQDKYGNMSTASFGTDRKWGFFKNGLTDKQKFMRFMYKRFDELYTQAFTPKPTMQKSTTSNEPGKAAMIEHVALTQKLNSYALNGRITTVPMFALSTDRRVLGKSCVVHCVEPRIFNANEPIENSSGKLTWFSGIYNMLGFTHKISDTSVESSFNISRPGNRGLSAEEADT